MTQVASVGLTEYKKMVDMLQVTSPHFVAIATAVVNEELVDIIIRPDISIFRDRFQADSKEFIA